MLISIDDLAVLIKQSCEKSPSVIQTCGKDLKIRRTWLDLNFPNFAPPTYERSGYVAELCSTRTILIYNTESR